MYLFVFFFFFFLAFMISTVLPRLFPIRRDRKGALCPHGVSGPYINRTMYDFYAISIAITTGEHWIQSR